MRRALLPRLLIQNNNCDCCLDIRQADLVQTNAEEIIIIIGYGNIDSDEGETSDRDCFMKPDSFL